MKIEELDNILMEYTEDELYYKNYFFSKQNPALYKSFIKNLDIEYIKARKLMITEANSMQNIDSVTEEGYFSSIKNNNISIVKHNRYTPVFTHKHDFFEMLYVYSGSFKQELAGDEVYLNAGDICIIPPGVYHSIHVFDDSVVINILIRKIAFSNTFLGLLSDENVLSSFFNKILFSENYSNYIIFRSGSNPKVKQILTDMVIEDMESQKYSNKILDNLLMVLFGYMLRDNENRVELPKVMQQGSQEPVNILTYLQNNFRSVTLEELSGKFHYTIPYLSKLIKSFTGRTFKEIVQTIKLNKATDLLLSSNLKIYAISEAVGYENTTHFIRTFNKVFGMPPSQYRKKHKRLL